MIATEPACSANQAWREIPGGITAPRGFRACGIHCGIKRARPDLALITSEVRAASAGVFTTSRVKAAPVLVSMEHLRSGWARAIVVASGNANACTGARGLEDARAMAAVTAEELGVSPEEVVVASTGVIGVPMPIEKVCEGIRSAASVLSPEGYRDAAEAILTTDRAVKEVAISTEIGGCTVRLGGIAKGSGMIHPNMATMLAFVTTDAAITPEMLRRALACSVEKSFNMITVDGDTSTNDMAVVLANGLAGNPTIAREGADFDSFATALDEVAGRLAMMIVKDGEGASKFIRVEVFGASTKEDARRVARTIASSNLVKTAVFGADPNWGRILAAAGRAGVDFDPELVDVYIGDILVAKAGAAIDFDTSRARNVLAADEVVLSVDLNAGCESASAMTCDLTYEYVKINASYTS
ncbi:MAG: bifunctional glutamate N-acetyltransferase/amino-acid acetyltransferase ArgJ [Bacillota bacterium]